MTPPPFSTTAGCYLGFGTPGFYLGLLSLVSFVFLMLVVFVGKEDGFDVEKCPFVRKLITQALALKGRSIKLFKNYIIFNNCSAHTER